MLLTKRATCSFKDVEPVVIIIVITLELGIIESQEQLKREFLNHFYNTCRVVSMIELTSSRQWKDEPMIDYIHRWMNLSLNYKEQLFESASIDICIQWMKWDLCCIFQGIQPKTFEEVAVRALDIDVNMLDAGNLAPLVQEPKKGNEKQEFQK